MALKLEGLDKNYEDQQFRMVQEQEDQWTRMAEQMDTTHSVSELLTSITTSELEGPTALASTSSLAGRVSTPAPVPPA